MPKVNNKKLINMSADGKEFGINRQLLMESVAIMLFSAIMFGFTFTFDRVPEIFAQGIQPTVFPRAILVIMFALAALQAFKSTRLSALDVKKLKQYEPVPLIVLLTGLTLILFVIAIRLIGTFPALIIFCPAVALLWGERRWKLMLLGFSIFVGFAYLLFRTIMNIPLP